MNRIVDYLERAVVFDRLAAGEENPEFKSMFENQAGAGIVADSQPAAGSKGSANFR